MNYGFSKIAAAIPSVRVADCTYNTNRILELAKQADLARVEVICFPELSITSYTCGDLFQNNSILVNSLESLIKIKEASKAINTIIIVGLPVYHNGATYNSAAVIGHGKIYGIVPKTYLPNYKEFYEKRWFASSRNTEIDSHLIIDNEQIPFHQNILFHTSSYTFAIEICEDMWAPIPPSSRHTLAGADVIFNLSADNEIIGKSEYVQSLIAQQSARTISGYIFSSCGYGESTQDIVFNGKAMIYENGTLLAKSKNFSIEEQIIVSEIDIEKLRSERRMNTTFAECQAIEKNQYITINVDSNTNETSPLTREINKLPFVPYGENLDKRCEEIFNIQVYGLAKRLEHTNSKTAVIGISGGLDSTLALLVTVKAFDKLNLSRQGIIGVTMPGFGTTDRTYTNAINLMRELGITIREINIRAACIQHFKDINHDISIHNITYENSQARERTQILMDIANQMSGLVIGTGDLSELALGWATYNGDHMSMYGVNVSIPKTLVKHLVSWVSKNSNSKECELTLNDIVNTPISPELIPADENGNIAQITEDLVGPYILHDFFLYYFLRYGFQPKKIFFLAKHAFKNDFDHDTIKKWLTTFCRRFFNQQFKRSCLPDGPKVGSCSLSPRGDWRMPSDANNSMWLEECENL